jgi:type III restriction enzyme
MSRSPFRAPTTELLLSQKFDAFREGLIERSFVSRVPPEIIENLNPRKPLREYQLEALGRFDFYLNEYRNRQSPVNLLFHMATGSGKTLLMAANILYLYQKGYRNFVFFVNSTNIIKKTRGDFLDPASPKYLFADQIRLNGRNIKVREVTNFDSATKDDINIIFTTIQGLHYQMHAPQEDAMTFQDFADRKVALISDETHHLNALTKVRGASPERLAETEDAVSGFDVEGLSREEETDLRSWEGTVRRIMGMNTENVLLEYTATIDFNNENILEKYRDRVIIQYDLRSFCRDRYSKDVQVVERDLAPIERALQAIVVSQYKRKVAEANGIDLKPVILFKSNRVKLEGLKRVGPDDIGSLEFRRKFVSRVSKLSGDELARIRRSTSPGTIFAKAFAYFDKRGISLDALAEELRLDFADERCLSVNDDNEAEHWQIAVNSLESHDNQYRAIFAVEKLNEGWDVLNLFDIVRLYDTRDARANQPGKTTISEAQLIGRGARYFPFRTGIEQESDRRKFDEDAENETRVLEQLHYHSARNPEYIQELRQALVQVGIDLLKTKKCPVRVKESFKKTKLWKSGVVFVNQRKRIERNTVAGFAKQICEARFRAKIYSGETRESELFEGGEVAHSTPDAVIAHKTIGDFPLAAIRKAIDRSSFFTFSNLKKYFPNLVSLKQFITDAEHLGCIKIEVVGPRDLVKAPMPDDQVNIVRETLHEIQEMIEKGWTEYSGTKEFTPVPIQKVVVDKELQISLDETGDQERGRPQSLTENDALRIDLRKKSWYVFDEHYGTSEEKRFVRFIDSLMDKLQERYSDVYLFRNEKEVKIYRLSDAKATEPDFLLFMNEKASGKEVSYQLFIESKGAHLIEHDQWKEDFLLEIEKEARIELLHENHQYRVMGMPFFSSVPGRSRTFEKDFVDIFLRT